VIHGIPTVVYSPSAKVFCPTSTNVISMYDNFHDMNITWLQQQKSARVAAGDRTEWMYSSWIVFWGR
jgi:hypothetical protein